MPAPTVDKNKLATGLTTIAQKGLQNLADGVLSPVTTLAEGASSFGITGLDGIMKTINDCVSSCVSGVSGLFSSLLSMCGLTSTPEVTPPPAPKVSPAPAAEPPAPGKTPPGAGKSQGQHR